MSHDPTIQLLGVTQSSDKVAATVYDSDPASFSAGIACRLGLDSLLTTTKGSNKWVGISLGASLSDTKKTTVLRAGSRVPVLLNLKQAYATVTITTYANLVSGTPDVLSINGTAFTAQAGAATPGTATFQAATSNAATATSLAAQINAHATIGALVRASAVSSGVINISSISSGTAGNAITIVYTDNDSNIGLTLANATGGHLNSGSDDVTGVDYVTIGANAYFDDVTGKASPNLYSTTVSDAVYVSGVLSGINESGMTVPVALVDMIGGL